jgi:dTDP-4-amino-4,6-dideoxygalactose transaminase
MIWHLLRSGKIHKNMKVDYFTFKHVPFRLRKSWNSAISNVIRDGQFIGGQSLRSFEKEFGKYLDVKNVIGVGNGYDAIFVALKTLGVTDGDVVAVPAHTFIATWLAVHSLGAVPYGIDCDQSGLIDLNKLQESDVNFKAVIPVHSHGQMVDMEKLKKWAVASNTFIVEDCAQAHGATFKSVKAGAWGDISAFSFYPTKNLGALGDAGAVVTNSKHLAEYARSFANYGSEMGSKYTYSELGINSRLDPIQASVLKVNLNYIDIWNSKRQVIAKKYLQQIGLIQLQPQLSNPNSVWHHFIILVKEREEVINYLKSYGIQTEIHYPKLAADIYSELTMQEYKSFPEAKHFVTSALSIPLNQWLKNKKVKYIIKIMNTKFIQDRIIL